MKVTLQIAGVAAVYYLAARVGLLLAFAYTNISPVWPPTGVALAALVVLGYRLWPGIALGALLANATTGIPLHISCFIAVGNTLEGVACAVVLGRFRVVGLTTVREMLTLFVAAPLCALIAATVGTTAIYLGGLLPGSTYTAGWTTWWLGDSMGAVVVGAALLAGAQSAWRLPASLAGAALRRVAESMAMAAVLVAVLWFVFVGFGGHYRYLVFPVLCWIGMRGGILGAALAAVAVSGVAVWSTVAGHGPFQQADVHNSLIYLQSFMAAVTGTCLIMAASVAESRAAQVAHEDAETRFRLALEHSDITVYRQDRELRYTWIYDGKHRFAPGAVIGRTDRELAPNDAAQLDEIKQAVLDSGEGRHAQVAATTGGRESVYDLVVEPLRDADGAIVGVSGVAHDITEIRQYQRQVETLNERLREAMRETHHRVKNNLQIIAAMIDMRLMDGEGAVPAEEVRRLGVHTRTLAAVHDLLTKEPTEYGEAPQVSTTAVIGKLVSLLESTSPGRPIRTQVADGALSPRKATSLAIIISELVGNAIKHGEGPIDVALSLTGTDGALSVSDHGPGFPDGFDFSDSAGTGLELVSNLARWDLGGEVRFANGSTGGARVEVTIAVTEPSVGSG